MSDLTIRFTSDIEDGTEREYELPARYEVCYRCEGRGTHVNPSIDGHGITEDEMAELGPDFREDYFSGVYDVACHKCNGLRVVLAVDEDHIRGKDVDVLGYYRFEQGAKAEHDAILAAEIAYGC